VLLNNFHVALLLQRGHLLELICEKKKKKEFFIQFCKNLSRKTVSFLSFKTLVSCLFSHRQRRTMQKQNVLVYSLLYSWYGQIGDMTWWKSDSLTFHLLYISRHQCPMPQLDWWKASRPIIIGNRNNNKVFVCPVNCHHYCVRWIRFVNHIKFV